MQDAVAIEFDWLKEAVSDDAPCGPNLEAVDDDSFIDYYFDAEVRLPERYFTPGLKADNGEGSDDRLFEPKSIDHKKEHKSIVSLLERSRDLRLLSLLARFSILAGRATGFADAIEGMALLLETHPDDAHPQIGKTASNRRMPLDDLGTAVTVTIPLQYLSLTGQPDVTYRRYLVATGKSAARTGEEDATTSQIIEAIGEAGTKPAVDKVYAALGRAAQGLERIKQACIGRDDVPFTPNFGETRKVISDLLELIQQARPDLTGSIESTDEIGNNATLEAAPANEAAPKTEVLAAGSATISGRPAAKAALQAVEQYFASREPSSAAVLLITQARLLIGRPLIEALETLLPEHSKNAVIDFGKETGFALSIERLRNLSSEIPAPSGEEGTQEHVAIPQIETRADVAAQIRGVEDYYRKNEPTSPIPILLVRATAYLDKDFNAIVAELFPIPLKE